MRNKSSLMIIASMVLILLGWNVGEAATWYVTKTGNDANTGNSLATAKLTIQAMINSGSVVNGDVIEIGTGTFQEQVVINSKSITLRGRGNTNTIIQAPTWAGMTTYNEATLLYWNTTNIANSLPTSTFKPVIFVDAASNSYTVNIYGIKIDGNTAAPAAPGQLFVGVMYKNAQGTVGNSLDTGKVLVSDIKGAGGNTENTIFGFGIACIGTANPLIQYNTFTGYHNAAVASFGRSLSSTLTSQMPYPVISNCNITGVTQNNTGWYSGIMSGYGGRISAQQNILRSHINTGGWDASGVLIYDGRNAVIGSNSVKNDGNNITGNAWGINVVVTAGIIGNSLSQYTIKNNNIAYNGNGNSGLTCTGAVTTTGCVRYQNTTSAADRTLTISNNAWGHEDPLNNGYGMSTGSPVAAGANTDAFWSVTSGDKFNVANPVFATVENVSPSNNATILGWGYSAFNTIQRAVDAAGDGTSILVDSATYTENVCVFTKTNVKIIGDSSATCGSGTKPKINPASGAAMHIFTLNTGAAFATSNITVNGIHFLQAGAQREGILVTGWDNTNAASNNPPTGTQVRNSCFEGYFTQTADGVFAGVTSASISTQEYPFGASGTSRQAWGGSVNTATAFSSDVDASANNNFNYNAVSTSPSFKLWEKSDGAIADGGTVPAGPWELARILQTNLIIVYCGDDLNVALAALGTGAVTVYVQGDCIYKSAAQLTIPGPFDMRVDYTGRQKYPPLIVEPNGIIYSNSAAGLTWATDCSMPGNPGYRFVTNATQTPLAASLSNGHTPSGIVPNASNTAMALLAPVNFDALTGEYQTTNYGLNRPANITVSGSNDGALVDAVSHIADSNGFGGTITLANGAAFTTNLLLQKRVRFTVAAAGNATTTGYIELRNKDLPFGPDCATTAGVGALDGILDTRVLAGTFTSLDVRVGNPGSVVVAERADNTDTTNTIQQGLTFTRGASTGVCQVNNLGNYTTGTAQTPTISRTQVTLTSDHATQFVQLEGGYITLNGSGIPANQSIIRRISVDTVKMTLGTDAIQTAIGASGVQNYEGVGLDNQAGNTTGATAIAPVTNRTGKIVFSFAGATSSQALTVDKDVRFIGNSATPNTNSGSLTMRLGAQGTMIDNSSNFCNSTVNVTQLAGSGYTQIPDIQTGILLACTSGTLNVGTIGVATSWGGGSDTYNRDNVINKGPLTVQGTNNAALCGFDNGAYIVDGSMTPAALAGRAFYSRFFNFSPANPVFKINAVSNVTIQGFDFVTLNGGAASALIYSDSASNSVLILNNNFDESTIRPIYSASAPASTNKTNWGIQCNWIHRTAGGTAGPADGILLERHSTTNNITDNAIDYNGYTTISTNGIRLVGVQNAQVLRNYIRAISTTTSNIFVDSLTTATGQASATGTLNIQDNDILNNTSASWGGIGINKLSGMSGTITIQNNFIRTNTTGVRLGTGTFDAISNTGWSIINNSFTNTTNALNYSPTYSGTVCQLNARGNWWEHASGPTNTFNPLNVTPCAASVFGDVLIQTGTCSSGDQSMTSYIPWWTIGTDAAAATDGWQQPAAANALARVVRTSSAGVWLENYANINNAVDDIDANSQKVFAIQGVFGWLPVSGMGDDWGEYFSEQVTYNGNGGGYTGNEIRGVTIKAYDCANTTMETWHTYLATTSNVTAPVPSGDIVHAPAAPISGNEQTGFFIDGQTATNADNTTIRNFRVQGFSSTGTPLGSGTPGGKAIMFDRVTNPSVDACWVEGSVLGGSTRGSIGIYLDRSTGGLLTSNVIGTNQAISSSNGSNAGIGIVLGDASQTNQTFGPNTVGQNAATATAAAMGLGITSGGNIIRNCERVGITAGHGAAPAGSIGATTILQYNTIQGVRDVVGTGGVVAIAGIHADATAGTLQINNNTIGGKGLTTQNDNNVDIEFASNTFTLSASSMNNTIRDSAQVVDGENYTVRSVSGGTRATELRTFFNSASGNTFSHAAILTTDARAPWDFSGAMNRNQDVVAIGGFVTIYRQIATPLANTSTVFSAGSETYNNVIEARENAGWTIGEIDQYYGENLAFQSTTGRVHQTILGPAVANGLNTTSAHIISSTGPGTGVAITAAGAENKYIRGGIVLHAIDGVSSTTGLYGSIPAGSANKGDVYLQRAVSGTDAGFVQFAYHATTFGSQALVSGTGQETTGNNSNTDKPTIIKAGLDDANDDIYAVTGAQNRRTGVFQAGNGTAFTKPTEPITGLGTDGLSAYPNPATNGDVTVAFQVTNNTFVRIALYDALGRKVTDLKSDNVTAGVYTTSFDVSNLLSGAYTVRMEYDYFTKTVPVLIVK